MVVVHGDVPPGYEAVRDAFAKTFHSRGEVGAAVAVVVDNQVVVDLWGGSANPRQGRPWQRDTLFNLFSTTKGLSALAVAHAHSRGLFEYDEPVATYWPEFAAHGKHHITVRTLLSHQAGLCAIDAPMTVATLADPDAVAAAIGPQKPAWTPGERHGYHAVTLGWYESRVDSTHRPTAADHRPILRRGDRSVTRAGSVYRAARRGPRRALGSDHGRLVPGGEFLRRPTCGRARRRTRRRWAGAPARFAVSASG